MSNPIGFAPRLGPPEGLGYSVVGPSSPPNYLGGGADPQVAGTYGYWYLRPSGDVFLTDGGPRCSPGPMNASHIDGSLVPYGAIPRNGIVTASNVSTVAADVAASASCEFVSVQARWTPGLGSGSPYCQEDVTDPSALTSFNITMGGGPVDLLATVWSGLAPPYASFTPLVVQPQGGNPAHLLRPAALTWPGQDPDNQWNRAIWHRSEIGAIAWAMEAYASSWTVDADYIVTGFNRETHYPTPCPIIPTITPPPPRLIVGSARGGPGVHGQLPRRHIHGNAGTGTIAAPPAQGSYSVGGLVQLAESVGLRGESAATAGAVAMAESGGNPSNVSHNVGPPPSNDRGLWQINDYYHPEVSDACAFDAQCNAGAMKSISSNGTNWTPWATYNNGLHLPFMDAARAAVVTIEGGGGMGAGGGNQGQVASN